MKHLKLDLAMKDSQIQISMLETAFFVPLQVTAVLSIILFLLF